MFCNACGIEIQPQFKVCPNCGRPIASAQPKTTTSPAGQHVHTLGILWVVAGAIFLIPAVILMAVSSIAHAAIPANEAVARDVGPLVLSIIGGSLLVIAVGGLLLGWGFLRHRPWARIFGIVLGILSLVYVPFGTALGIYTLWVLFSEQGVAECDAVARAV